MIANLKMTMPAAWIRKNMLYSGDQYERQPTEAELKVQRSLQKLSIPDWYLNKRSNPPQILNVKPVESRPSSWKSFASSKNITLNSTASNVSDIHSPVNQKLGETFSNIVARAPITTSNSKIPRQQKTPESRNKKSPAKSSASKNKVFDTSIPEVKISKNISKTFPKMSPCRKIQNINLVFPPGPKIELSKNLTNDTTTTDSKYKTFILNKQPINANKKSGSDSNRNDRTPYKSMKTKNASVKAPEIVTTPLRTPNFRSNFMIRTNSTPKFSPARIFSSTVIEDPPKSKKTASPSILEKSFIFEHSPQLKELSDNLMKEAAKNRRSRRMSPGVLEKTSIFENSSRNESCPSYEDTSAQSSKTNWLLEENIRSIDPILFEKDESPSLFSRPSSTVRDIVRKIEVSGNSLHTPQKKSTMELKDSTVAVQEKQHSNLYKKYPASVVQKKKIISETESPCTRFINSKRKSRDLENVVKSKQMVREKSLVQGIIESLTEKMNKSKTPRQNQNVEINHNFVKQLVEALEKADVSKTEDTTSARISMSEEDSSSESEAKSYVTSGSPKDTDSCSDFDHRLYDLNSNNAQRFDYESITLKNSSEIEEKSYQEDDSVYWIPVSRCKLPRTSSLLSMISKLSANGYSPCISPIRSKDEIENIQNVAWENRKTNAVSKKLFKIDETVVIDSGYSEKSDRSVADSRSSMTDSIWYEDTQNDSEWDTTCTKFSRSSGRKWIMGHALCIH